MKKILLTLLPAFGLFLAANAQVATNSHEGHDHDKPAATPPVAKTDESLKFKETEHSFGEIPQGKPVYYDFVVMNTGIVAMKLDNVTASCGCTTPEWTKDPIASGGSTKIKVGFNASAEGYFEKYITVNYNSNQTKQIKITGTVWKAPDGAAPVNASVDFLKKQSF